MNKAVTALLALILLMAPLRAPAEPEYRGYQRGEGYQYALFGAYPYEKDGTEQPLLWRLLIVDGQTAFVMTEYIVDFVRYHSVKDTDDAPLAYRDADINAFCNGECLKTMFTAAERGALTEMGEGRGKLSCPTTAELQNPQTGFSKAKYTVDRRRHALGTPYAYEKGLKKIVSEGYSWYFTADRRRAGARWIVGDNGHISVVGADRTGGLRPVAYVRLDAVACVGGEGTLENPFQWQALVE